MTRTRHTAEPVIAKLREAELMLLSGKTQAQVIQHLGVSEQTFDRWRAQFGNMEVDETRRLKELEIENNRLKKLIADQAIDISILKEANKYLGKHQANCCLSPLRSVSLMRRNYSAAYSD